MPDYWIMTNEYSATWDAHLNALMHTYDFIPVPDGYTAKLGNYEIWIENHPYGSFSNYRLYKKNDIRPSKMTIYKAMKKFQKDFIKYYENQKASQNQSTN